MGKGLDDLIGKLKYIQNHLAEEVAPQINVLFEESANRAVANYYGSYDPRVYERTMNFMHSINSAKTVGVGNLITMSIDSSLMNDYPGWFGKSLNSAAAFDMFFMNGEHGHGRFLMSVSIPPNMLIAEDVESQFQGRASEIIDNAIARILNS